MPQPFKFLQHIFPSICLELEWVVWFDGQSWLVNWRSDISSI